jgi:Zn-dependent oligopeptidase
VYDNKTFNGFARHYKTGKPVPSDMFAKIQGSQTYRTGELQGFSSSPAQYLATWCHAHARSTTRSQLAAVACSTKC